MPTVPDVERARPDARPAAPVRLHHVAYIAKDTTATVEFYTRILGMSFAAAVLDDAIPSTREPVPYFHSFFRMPSGETLAFFEAPDLPPQAAESHGAYRTFKHLALEVDGRDEVDAWVRWLEANDIAVIGPVDHGIIYSIYFFDPNGVRLELTTSIAADWNRQEGPARIALAEWEAVKARAQTTGGDVAVALDALSVERSHRRALHLDEEK
jgi:catechol 2,3-dioxygenase-like lactoylglutathione lyase family enzyme